MQIISIGDDDAAFQRNESNKMQNNLWLKRK